MVMVMSGLSADCPRNFRRLSRKEQILSLLFQNRANIALINAAAGAVKITKKFDFQDIMSNIRLENPWNFHGFSIDIPNLMPTFGPIKVDRSATFYLITAVHSQRWK